MGLFSSKKKTFVDTSVVRFIEDDFLPNSIRAAVMGFLMQGGPDDSVSDFVVDELLNSIGIKANNVYRWAKNNYVHGVPKSNFSSAVEGKQAVQDYLNSLYGHNINIIYSRIGEYNLVHNTWLKLVQDYGYDSSSNIIQSIVKQGVPVSFNEIHIPTEDDFEDLPVYVKDFVISVPTLDNAEEVSYWGTLPSNRYTSINQSVLDLFSPSVFGTSSRAIKIIEDPSSLPGVIVKYTWIQKKVGYVFNPNIDNIYEPLEVKEEEIFIPLPNPNEDADFIQFCYEYQNKEYYFTYELGKGTIPILDNAFEITTYKHGDYYPFMYYRYEKTPEDSDKTSQSYKDNKRMHRMLGINYQDILEEINENPDIADVEQAMLIFAADANSENPLELKYLWEFFKDWYDNSEYVPIQNQPFSGLRNNKDNSNIWEGLKNTIFIEDNRFRLTLTNDGITLNYSSGSIKANSKVGDVILEKETKILPIEYVENTFEGPINKSKDIEYLVHTYRKQIAPNLIASIQLTNLETKYYIYADGKREYFTTSDDEEKQDILIIPLKQGLLNTFTTKDREELYGRSLKLIFNSRVTKKVKWYQTGIFRVIITVVAIVAAFYLSPAFAGAVSTAIAGGASAVIALIVKAVLINIAVTLVMRISIKLLGVKAAILLAVIIAIATFGHQLDFFSLDGLPFADELLSIGSNIVDATSSAISAEIGSIQADIQNFAEFAKHEWENLMAVDGLLDSKVALSPYIFIGENPTDFYNRTVHAGNMGSHAIQSISQYVDIKLMLPQASDNILGDTNYGLT